jgi:hypothetical protein
MQAPKYLLIAEGSIAHPSLHIDVTRSDVLDATAECKKIASLLVDAGYHRYTLFNVEQDDVVIIRFSVEKGAAVIRESTR